MLVLDLLLDWIGHRTARYLLPALSFSRLSVDDLLSSRTGFNAFGCRNEGDGTLLVSSSMSGWIGLFFWAMLLIVFLALY